MPKKEKILHNKGDLKFIQCAVCEEVAKVVHRTISDMRKELAPGKKLKEIDIIEKLEKICKPDEDEGLWITRFDLVERNRQLQLEDQGAYGKCKVECQTVAKACDNVLGEHDTDVAELLYQESAKRSQLSQLLCHDLTDVCNSKPPKLPKKGRPHDEEWIEVDEKELQMQKLMRDMQGAGMPGMSMYGRDELQDQLEGMKEMYGYGDDYGDYGDGADGDDSGEGEAEGDDQAAYDSVKSTVNSAVKGAKDAAAKVSSAFTGSKSDELYLPARATPRGPLSCGAVIHPHRTLRRICAFFSRSGAAAEALVRIRTCKSGAMPENG
eukprot:CAMPEP_0177595942 /NCGR_PEP_ID=MMETSP0419_2-20121207/10687_1 /TAXON_ID=582737 /ORGANISM="Tetraselmis sp., Strain GSL018" /LENGTH=322 /DNA_ID=CAMNT_0019087559 /DNA_START=147 /DNA_END=1112 /DNA_ORIENTATION=+